MMKLLIAAVILGGGFGSAAANVESEAGDTMVIDIEVEVQVSAETVVAHLTFEDDPVLTLPMIHRGDSTFGVTTELEAKNYIVVFEAVGDEGETSIPVSLAQMGAQLGPESNPTTTTTTSDEISADNRQMLWLAIAAGAASLSVLAFWVLGPKEDSEIEEVSEEE